MSAQSLHKAPVINPGGLCKIIYFRHEDVLLWPSINPVTGILSDAVQLKVGRLFYYCQATEKERSFSEENKEDGIGSYVEMEVSSRLAGNTSANVLSIDKMRFHRYGIIVHDRNGDQRLIGNEDSGAKFFSQFSTSDISGSRMRQVRWTWQHPLSAPIYQADAFVITIGGVTITAGSLQIIMRFRVGAAGAPMVDAQTLLSNAGFANKNLLVIASGLALVVDDLSGAIDFTGSVERHYEKTFAGSQITFVGGVTDKEIIEIYAWS